MLNEGRAVGVNEETYVSRETAIAMASKYRAKRLVWCNETETRALSDITSNEGALGPHGQDEVLQADVLREALNEYSQVAVLEGSLEKNPKGAAVAEEWAKHKLFKRHAGRAVIAAQCHGLESGAWLRLGHHTTELSFVGSDGMTVDLQPWIPSNSNRPASERKLLTTALAWMHSQ